MKKSKSNQPITDGGYNKLEFQLLSRGWKRKEYQLNTRHFEMIKIYKREDNQISNDVYKFNCYFSTPGFVFILMQTWGVECRVIKYKDYKKALSVAECVKEIDHLMFNERIEKL